MQRGLFRNDYLMILGLLIVAGLVIYTSGVLKKDCERDKLCFQSYFQECKTAKLITIKNDNVYSYSVESSFSNSCNLRVRMERIALGADPHFERLLEDKEMYCNIPRDTLAEVDPDNFNTFLDYCSGELKEGLYELVIERMYTLVVKELHGILQQSERALLEKV